MRYTEDFSDERSKSWCIHCGKPAATGGFNRDHVPTKSLLSDAVRRQGAKFDENGEEILDYLPQVRVCKPCNLSFSGDENYLLCVLHAVTAGTLYPDPNTQRRAYDVLRSNRNIVRELKCGFGGQMLLFDDLKPFTLYPDPDRISRVLVKNARGHVLHELGESFSRHPEYVAFKPLNDLDERQKKDFERTDFQDLDVFPQVGSRMMERMMTGADMTDGWVVVEPTRYRFSVSWGNEVTVKSVIWEYLATETSWRHA